MGSRLMKDMLQMAAVFLGATSWSLSGVAGEIAVRDENLSLAGIFVPAGYDNNDEVTVVLDGFLPDSCHKLIAPAVEVDHENRQIVVQAKSRVFPPPCAVRSLIPFTQTVSVGSLQEGVYTIYSNENLLEERINVEAAPTATPDSFLYAPVESATVEAKNGRFIATLTVHFTDNCMQITDPKKNIRVIPGSRSVVILPIMSMREDTECGKPVSVRKTFSVALPNLAGAGRYLLHVRSLNGSAVNQVFQAY